MIERLEDFRMRTPPAPNGRLCARCSAVVAPYLHLGEVEIDLEHQRALRGGTLLSFSRLQWVFIRVVAAGGGLPVYLERVAEAVYGEGDYANCKAVRSLVYRIRRRLGRQGWRLRCAPNGGFWFETTQGVRAR